MSPRADVVAQDFPAAPRQGFRFDRHYLLCATAGVIRISAEGRDWSLPPSRAALIRAGEAVEVTLPGPVKAASVLFDRGFLPDPPQALVVIDLTPLARALVAEARRLGPAEAPGQGLSGAILQALGAVALDLARRPSPAWMPVARSPGLARALALTEAALADDPDPARIAAEAGMSPRSLARHALDELGMTWRAALRRMRMIRAMELFAAEDLGVAEAAFATGYGSVAAFTAAFRDFAGMAPAAWRNHQRQDRVGN